MFSMTILTKEEAEGDPVGEAQEEPNQNPFLKKPTAGRGLAEALGSFDYNFDFDWNPFGKFLPFLICLFIILTLLCIFMYWRLLG